MQAKSFIEPTAINSTKKDGKGYLTQWRPMNVDSDVVDMLAPWFVVSWTHDLDDYFQSREICMLFE